MRDTEQLITIVFVLLIILAIISTLGKSKNKKNNKKQNNPTINNNPVYNTQTYQYTPENNIQQYPYRKKYLLTKTEYSFYTILKQKCDTYNYLICPKVRLEDFIDVTTNIDKLKYRGYIKSRHVDFIICDNKLNIIAAIELDDSSHLNIKSQKTDEFKNNLFKTIGIPLYRIMIAKQQYDEILSHILQEIYQSSKANVYNLYKKIE